MFHTYELTNAFAKNDYVLITGDINIDYLKPLPSNWETILSTYGLDQLVHDPNRVTSKSVTLIDHIYTSRPEEVVQVRVSTYCPGDHYPVSCSVKYGKKL
jgi:endonuclease/exonuclease/phosphatase family metal-dependent hydrolase